MAAEQVGWALKNTKQVSNNLCFLLLSELIRHESSLRMVILIKKRKLIIIIGFSNCRLLKKITGLAFWLQRLLLDLIN